MKKILKGAVIAFIFTIISLTIFASLLVYTNMSEHLIQPVIIGVTAISILFGSFIANKRENKNGIITGIIISIIYIGLIYLISSAIKGGDFRLNMGAVIMILVGMFCGAVGGILGVNIK